MSDFTSPDVFVVLLGSVLLALLLDIWLGEPKRWHPLVGFGSLAIALEAWANPQSRVFELDSESKPEALNCSRQVSRFSRFRAFFSGMFCWVLLVITPTILIVIGLTLLERVIATSWWIDAIVLYFAIGYTSLKQHALAVFEPLSKATFSDVSLTQARQQLSMIVSRDTESLDEKTISKATIESVLENGSDAIFAPIFWFVLGGVPGVLVYRLANTLDAMWGYKTERFLWFGRFSAKMDDILNWLPSRLVGLSYALLGSTTSALRCWRDQAYQLESPAGGVVMASGAGSLELVLGGDTSYHGKIKSKPEFGCGAEPKAVDIHRSVQLISRTVFLWCAVLVVLSAVLLMGLVWGAPYV